MVQKPEKHRHHWHVKDGLQKNITVRTDLAVQFVALHLMSYGGLLNINVSKITPPLPDVRLSEPVLVKRSLKTVSI